jgi:hypothetical protein
MRPGKYVRTGGEICGEIHIFLVLLNLLNLLDLDFVGIVA